MAATAGLLLDPDFWQVVIADLPDLSEYCEYAAPVDPGQGDGEGGVCNS
jgi:hypothetical protein